MSATFKSMWANAVARASPFADMLIFPFVADDAGETPVFLGYLLYNDMEVRRLCAGILHHGIRDCADQRLLLQRRPPRAQLYRQHRQLDVYSNIFLNTSIYP